MKRKPSYQSDYTNTLKTFLEDLKASSVNVPYPLQQKSAEFIASAWQQRPNDAGALPLPESLSRELERYGTAATVQDAQRLILQSQFGTIGEFAQNALRNAGGLVEVGDVFSEATVAALRAFPSFDASKGSITNYLVNTFRGALTNAVRGSTPSGVTGIEMDALSADMYGDPFAGQAAPVEIPAPLPWYQNLFNSLSGSSIPSGIYALPGQSLFENSGQLNPELSFRPFKGSQQVWIGQQELQPYLDAQASGLAMGDPRIVARVEQLLRAQANSMLGGEYVGGNVIGANAQMLDAEFMGQPFGMQQTREPVPGKERLYTRSLEAMQALDAAGGSEFDAYGALSGLASTPSQKLSARMAYEIRVRGRLGQGFFDRYGQSDALRVENAAGFQAANRIDPNDLMDWNTEFGPLPSDIPPEYADRYRNYVLTRGGDMTRNLSDPNWEPTVPMPEEPPAPGRTNFGNYGSVSGVGNSSRVTSRMSAAQARLTLETNFPEFTNNFLGYGNTKLEEFNSWKSSLPADKQALFNEAWGTLRAEHGQAKTVGAQSTLSQWWGETGGWKGTPAPAAASVPPSPAAQPVPQPVTGAGTLPPDDMDPNTAAYTAYANRPQSALPNIPPPGVFVPGNPTPAPQTGAPLNAPQVVTSDMIGALQTRAANLDLNSLGRFNSSRLGTFQVTSRDMSIGGRFGSVTGGHVIDAGGQETLSEAGARQAVDWGRDASQQSLAQGGMEGLDPTSAVATFRARAADGIRAFMDQYVREMGGSSPEAQAAAKLTASRIGEVAKDVVNNISDDVRATTNQTGNYGDFQYNSVRGLGRNVQDIQAMMDANPQFADLINSLGGPQAAARGPRMVQSIGNDVFDFGGPGYGGGSGGGYGGTVDSNGFRHKSLYQTDFGRLMMVSYMAGMGWQRTGGAVLKEADAYGMAEYGMEPLMAYGGGSLQGTPAAYASQKALATQYSGSLAYQQYGMFLNGGYTFGGGPVGNGVTQIEQAGAIGLGAGIMGYGLSYGAGLLGLGAVGAAAAPIALGAGLAVGTPLLGMAGYNAFTGQTPDQGASFRNYFRGVAINRAEVNQNFWDIGAQLGLTPGTGTAEDQYLAKNFAGQNEIDVIKNGLGPINQLFPNLAASLVGPTAQQKSIQDFATNLSNQTGLKYDDVTKQLAPIQSMLGGLDTPFQKDLATKLINLSQDTGMDQVSIANQMATARGLAPGSRDFNQLVKNYADLKDNGQRDDFILEQRHEVQAFSQFAPYLQGTTQDAGLLYTGLGMNMPQSQNFAQVAAQLATSQNRELSVTQQWNLGALSQQLGKYSTPVATMANQLDQLGVVNFEQAYTNLGGMVQGGTDINYLKEIMGGNRYAWSDFGRQAGIGVYQTIQPNGLPAGTTDMTGLLLYERQSQLRNTNLTNNQTLSAMGVSDVGYQNALMSGGTWGLEDLHNQRIQNLTQQGFALQQSQINNNASYLNTTWGISQQQDAVSWASQQFGFGQAQKQLNLSNQFFQENQAAAREQSQATNQYQNWSSAFSHQTSLMQRSFAREDMNFSEQMNNLQYGWNLEDINEQIRRSSGYERSQLIKQRDRMATTQDLTSSHAEQERKNQEELWKREDEQYKKQQDYNKHMQELEKERFEREERQQKEMQKLQQENLDEQRKTATTLHDLAVKLAEAQHQHSLDQLQFSQKDLEIQQQMNAEQVTYQKAMTEIQRLQSQMAADWQKIASYSPAFKDALDAFYEFMLNTISMANSLAPVKR